MWNLLSEYEADLQLLKPIDPMAVAQKTDLHEEAATLAVIESSWGVHKLEGKIEIRATRQMPANFQVNLNLNLQAPPGVNPNNAAGQQALQQMLAAIQQPVLQQAQQAVQDALKQQAPVVKLEAGFRGGLWTFKN